MDIETLVVQGIHPETDGFRALVPPIYLTTTFAQEGLENFGPYQYTRGGNPTRAALETLVAGVEGANHAFAFATGMAASAAFFSLFRPGDRVLLNSNIYGGTYAYVKKVFSRYGIEYRLVEDLNRMTREELTDDVKGIFIETPSNPLLRVTDLKRISALAHERGILVGIDNTFLTPYYQKCLELGADAVIYSATKYFSGHADVTAGLVTTNRAELAEHFRFEQVNQGAPLAPFDCYSLIRGIKTLSVRYDRQSENALKLISFLETQPGVARLYYAGSHSQQEREAQTRQAGSIGAVFSFDLDEGYDANRFLSALRVFALAPSLGGVESLAEHVPTMSHQSFSAQERAALGIQDGLIRLAVGIESIRDLTEDLRQALESAGPDRGERVPAEEGGLHARGR